MILQADREQECAETANEKDSVIPNRYNPPLHTGRAWIARTGLTILVFAL